MDPLQEEAYYIQACCWVGLQDFDKAYATMKRAAIQIEAPTRNTLSICAYIAAKIHPPRYMEAVDSITAIVKNNAHDYEAVSTTYEVCWTVCGLVAWWRYLNAEVPC
jgi:hypothetical protein